MAQQKEFTSLSEASDICRLRTAGVTALAEQFVEQQSQLKRLIRGGVGRQLRRRLDASDVLQDVYLEASRSLSQFLLNPVFSAKNWLVALTTQRLRQLLRRHFLAKCRSLSCELDNNNAEDADFSPLAEIADRQSSPSARVMRKESSHVVVTAVRRLSADDQTILQLRTHDGISNVEAAELLCITPAAATKRYVRALDRLNSELRNLGWSQE